MDSDSDCGSGSDSDSIDAAIQVVFGPVLSRKHGGLRPGKSQNIDHQRSLYANLLMQDYFTPNCTYPDDLFRRRFRMSRDLFLHVMNTVEANDSYFTQRKDAVGMWSLFVQYLTIYEASLVCLHINA
ncbi:hypothetical protein AaE_011524 [Aphanomyces astaci]|uniref:Uncharacterized protein n=1 Tax=Aphanomyces astaci TaxID=112090 RepID=A0A6A4ZVX6_APHAT|nr:hypothetical protein AaE_011524 [Aphanomyces astaci]